MPKSGYADLLLQMRPVWGGRWDEAGSTVIDYSGGGHDLTVTGGTRSAKVGPTRRVDAIDVAASGTVQYSGVPTAVVDNLTILAWVRVTTSSTNGCSISYVGNGASNGYGIYVDSTGTKIRVLCGNVAFVDFAAAPTYTVGADYFIVAQRIATTWSMLVNMQYQGTGGTTTPGVPTTTYTALGPAAGFAVTGGGIGTFDRVLSNGDIGQLYNAGLRDGLGVAA